MEAGLPQAVKRAAQVQQTHFSGFPKDSNCADHRQAPPLRFSSAEQFIHNKLICG